MKYNSFLRKSKNESGLATDILPADSDLLVSRPKKEHSVVEFFEIKFCQMTEPANGDMIL